MGTGERDHLIPACRVPRHTPPSLWRCGVTAATSVRDLVSTGDLTNCIDFPELGIGSKVYEIAHASARNSGGWCLE
ncbi:hypothetical protein GONAM_03_00380 [Gordonia namibiensis NBRC 108229]|uniref:Uncharacterized protein n=1 Tax=Gordonia namibiensis NBRC 108229 TaxID=1208314 RepID=K6XJ64_9ACTN|nr:hypothetical protein GONAM_03_00380 [Gordonia namibiensis NBRC 108229]